MKQARIKNDHCPIMRAERGETMPNEELRVAREKIEKLLEEVGLDLNGKKREHLVALQRRAKWLETRTENARNSGKVLHYDEAELAATKWAVIQIIVLEAEIKRLREDQKDLETEVKRFREEHVQQGLRETRWAFE